MITFTEVEQLLKRFTYKPNAIIAVRPSEPGGNYLGRIHLQAWVPDATQPSRPFMVHGEEDSVGWIGEVAPRAWRSEWMLGKHPVIRVHLCWYIPPDIPTEARFWDWLRSFLTEFELHERDEFFRVDGKAIFDPHAV